MGPHTCRAGKVWCTFPTRSIKTICDTYEMIWFCCTKPFPEITPCLGWSPIAPAVQWAARRVGPCSPMRQTEDNMTPEGLSFICRDKKAFFRIKTREWPNKKNNCYIHERSWIIKNLLSSEEITAHVGYIINM